MVEWVVQLPTDPVIIPGLILALIQQDVEAFKDVLEFHPAFGAPVLSHTILLACFILNDKGKGKNVGKWVNAHHYNNKLQTHLCNKAQGR